MAKAKFENIEANHIVEAVKIFNAEGYPSGFTTSKAYDVEIDGELYPPKAIMAYANQLASGEPPENNFKGGRKTDCFDAFARNGFKIHPRANAKNLSSWIEGYKKLISDELESSEMQGAYNELYKWEGIAHFQQFWKDDATPLELEGIINAAFAKTGNLLRGAHFYPLGMLEDMAESRPAELSEAFKVLFDESRSLVDRLAFFEGYGNEFIKEHREDVNNHYQSRRAMMVYLVLRFPEKYVLYKNGMFNDFCSLTGFWPKYGTAKRGTYDVITNYLEMCDALKSELRKDQALLDLHKKRLPEDLQFNDDDNMLVQDFMYSVTTYLNVKQEENAQDGWTSDEKRLVAVLQSIGHSDANALWNVIGDILDGLSIQEGDERLCYSLPQSQKLIGLTVGQRYVVTIEKKRKSSEYRYYDELRADGGWLKSASDMEEIQAGQDRILKNVQNELERTSRSGFREEGSIAMEKTFFDSDYREEVFQSAFAQQAGGASEAIKAEFTRWLADVKGFTEGSIKSYLKAIEVLESNFGVIVYLQSDQSELEWLYQDLIKHQTKEDGKYHYRKSASLGLRGFYSAAVGKFIEFQNRALPMATPMDLNQIFFGPPGTGKTYNTINESIRIVDPAFFAEHRTDRKALRARFQELLLSDSNESEGRIGFTTFHQSMSYEDFVEGIKPKRPEEGDTYLQYDIEDGIFKNMCRLAEDALGGADRDAKIGMTSKEFERAQFFKLSLGNTLDSADDEVYDYCIENNCISIGFGGGVNYSARSEKDIREMGAAAGLGSYDVTAINMFANHLEPGSIVVVSKGNRYVRAIGRITGDYEFREDSPFVNNMHWRHFRSVEWIYHGNDIPAKQLYQRNLSQMTIYKLDKRELIESFFCDGNLTGSQKSSNNFVLIIDEINRGNVSSIFGELITLIEPDKRAGQAEQLSVTLPYSKSEFSVPSNLYVIGTMNTTDRSVEALDAALRRRFTFKEMAPKASVIEEHGALRNTHGEIEKEGIDLVKIFDAMNRRIALLLDKDHCIGHSYFMKVETKTQLISMFENKVIPLLEEYFFSDYGKISLVLGKSFIEVIEEDAREVFAANDYDQLLVDELSSQKTYQIRPSEDWDFNSIYA